MKWNLRYSELGNATWQISLASGESIVVQTSTNLVSWVPHGLFTGGSPVEWFHHCTDNVRYFRIVPND